MITVSGKVYLTPNEAAQAFGVPSPTVYLWCRTGEVKLLTSAAGPGILRSFTGSKYLIERESMEERARKLLCVS